MIIEHGPRELRGVSQLQYIGDDAEYKGSGLSALAKPLGLLAAGALTYAIFTKKSELKKKSAWALAGAILLHAILPP